MGKLIQLPGEQWAELREPADVSERLRRPIGRALRRISPEVLELSQVAGRLKPDSPEQKEAALAAARAASDEETDAFSDANDLAVVALVEKWSFPQPISLDSLLDLPHAAYDVLRKKVAPLVNDLYVDATPSPEPGSPFVSSNGSDTRSTEEHQTSSLTSGEPSD